MYYKHTRYLINTSTTVPLYVRFIMVMLQKCLGFLNVFFPLGYWRIVAAGQPDIWKLCRSVRRTLMVQDGGGDRRKKVDSQGK